jgi:hypothetical protein
MQVCVKFIEEEEGSEVVRWWEIKKRDGSSTPCSI